MSKADLDIDSLPTTSHDTIESQDSTVKESQPQEEPNMADSNEVPQVIEEKWEDVLGSGGLLKQILVEGKPESRPQQMQRCSISYTCTLDDGTVVETKNDLEVLLGDSEIVQGLDLALGLMNVGEKCKLKIEGRLAYGSKGLYPLVPPDASVNYEVELISVQPEEDTETLTINERRARGNKKREVGNWWYGRGDYQIAIRCYRRALEYLDEVEGGISKPTEDGEIEISDATLQLLLEDRISVSNNMAAAQLKLELYDAALQSLQTVTRCQPTNVKALFRLAKVYRAKNDITAAMKCLKKAEKYAPDNGDLLKEISAVEKIRDKNRASERELARRMFNGFQKDTKPQKKQSPSKLLLWSTVGASVAVGLLGVAVYRFKFV